MRKVEHIIKSYFNIIHVAVLNRPICNGSGQQKLFTCLNNISVSVQVDKWRDEAMDIPKIFM